MSDINDMNDEELFEGAKDTFASKFHLKNRLIVMYPTGVHGTREGENGSYPWYETTTIVMDDGPGGWQAQVPGEGGELEDNLVPSVAENGPQVLEKFQWSAGAFTSRLAQKVPGRFVNGEKLEHPGAVSGRVNTIKNSKKGLAPPWSIDGTMTDEDKALCRRHIDILKAARRAIMDARQASADDNAF